MATWKSFLENRPPDEPALYWWRVPPRDFGGLTAQPHFVEELSRHYDGCRDVDKWLPNSSTWTGYRWEVPAGLEWCPAENGAKKRDERWPDIKLEPCPFCGVQPEIKSWQASRGIGGGYGGLVITSKFYLHNWFTIRHSCRAMNEPRSTFDLAGLVSAWNTRA